jgi:hypothetical protein
MQHECRISGSLVQQRASTDRPRTAAVARKPGPGGTRRAKTRAWRWRDARSPSGATLGVGWESIRLKTLQASSKICAGRNNAACGAEENSAIDARSTGATVTKWTSKAQAGQGNLWLESDGRRPAQIALAWQSSRLKPPPLTTWRLWQPFG